MVGSNEEGEMGPGQRIQLLEIVDLASIQFVKRLGLCSYLLGLSIALGSHSVTNI